MRQPFELRTTGEIDNSAKAQNQVKKWAMRVDQMMTWRYSILLPRDNTISYHSGSCQLHGGNAVRRPHWLLWATETRRKRTVTYWECIYGLEKHRTALIRFHPVNGILSTNLQFTLRYPDWKNPQNFATECQNQVSRKNTYPRRCTNWTNSVMMAYHPQQFTSGAGRELVKPKPCQTNPRPVQLPKTLMNWSKTKKKSTAQRCANI